ncbi:MAG: phosphatase PAP2 family protein [Pseudomonadota bacterium]
MCDLKVEVDKAGLMGSAPGKRETAAISMIAIVAGLFIWLVFWSLPNLDMTVSTSFTSDNGRFLLVGEPWIHTLRKFSLFLIFGFYVVVIGAWIDAYRRQVKILGKAWHKWSYLGFCALFGPVLLVNVILKGNWGRSRPQFLQEFGGTLEFTPFWQWADQCKDNCSFNSGETAGVFMIFISLAFIAETKLRYVIIVIGLVVSAFISWIRLALGAHFLSDVLMSIVLMGLVAAVTHYFFYLCGTQWIERFDEKQQEKLSTSRVDTEI